MMAYRAAVHDSTKCSPNVLMLGWEIDFTIDIIAQNPPNCIEETCVVEYVEFVQEDMACFPSCRRMSPIKFSKTETNMLKM